MVAIIFKKTKTYIIDLIKPESVEQRRPLVVLMTAILLILAVTYFYLLTQTIFNAVAHQSLENQIPRANAQLQEKKFEHMFLRNSLNKDKAEEIGLVVLSEESIEYITRDPVGFRGVGY